jgi:uncharacterized damage-inducible protein DinB
MTMNPDAIAPLIDRYAAGAEILTYATQQLSPEQQTAKVGPGAWTVAELVAHLLDSDLVLADRMKRIIAEDSPTLLAFDEGLWLDRLRSREQPVDEAVNLFVANRRWITRLLRSLAPSDFARAGMHSEAGRKTLADIVSTAAGHVDHHLVFLYGKRANLGTSLYPRYTLD